MISYVSAEDELSHEGEHSMTKNNKKISKQILPPQLYNAVIYTRHLKPLGSLQKWT